ncbi:MAG TPA: O-antigen ligase family protein [Gemmatimonadaceae bacterium]|nr:O-antigen ligase family protein [Gemmatimonadaceae bacterium]
MRVRPASVLRAALLVFTLTNLGRIPILDLGDREAPILVNDLAVGALVVVGAIAMARARSAKLSDVALTATAFCAIGALSAVAAIPRFGLNAFEVAAGLAYLARWILYFMVYVTIVNCIREGDVDRVWRTLEVALLLFAAFGVVQSAFLPDLGVTLSPEDRPLDAYDPQGQRLVSTVLEPNIAAGMLLTVLLVQIAQLAYGVRMPMWKPGFLLVALILTISRSGALAFVVGVGVILVVRGLRKRALKFGALGALMGVAAAPLVWGFVQKNARLGVTDASALSRVVSWQRAISTFWENRWFGVGFNTYGFVQEHRGFERVGGSSYSVEGGLLFVAVMTGIVGLCVYSGMLWAAVRRCRAIWRDHMATPAERGLALGAAAATIAICVHSVFVNSLLTPWVMEPLWVLWGLTFIVATALRSRRVAAEAA